MSELASGTFGGDVLLNAEQRRELGLEPDESLRVLHAGQSTLLFERTRSAAPIALPWDRDLVLTAEVRAFPLADILNIVHASGKSGFLYFRREEHEKSVYLHRGEVVFATSNQIVDRLGESLLRSGLVTLEQLRDAERSFQPPQRFGKVLVQRGILTPRALWNGVKAQVEDIVRSLFAYTAGTVHFWEGDVHPDNVVRLSLPTQRLVAEGLQRRDELFRLLARVEDPRVRLHRLDAKPNALAANERAFLEALEAADEFQDVCRRVGLDPLSGARTLQLLSLIGAVQIVRDEESANAAQAGDPRRERDEAVHECVVNHVKLLAELAAPLVALDGAEVVAQRINGLIEDSLGRHAQALQGIRAGRSGTLDPEQIVSRVLRLPGDRVRSVTSALEELASYLEFELRNHPRIQEPEVFLEAVEELRASLEL
jgi:hypothetical protein